MKNLCLLAACFFLGIFSAYGIANVKISKFTNQNICSSYPSVFVPGSFSITETRHSSRSGFSANQTNVTLVIGFSNSNFRFNPNVGTVTATGTEITINSYTIAATSITVTITTAATNKELNAINFNNIEINAIAAASGFITRTGGTFKINNKTAFPASTISWGDLTAGVPLTYSSSIATQTNTLPVFTGVSNNQILGVEVVVTGTCSFLTATSFNFTDGSSNRSTDITNAKLYYTGVTNVFSTATLFGSVAPNTSSFTISGSQPLNLGAGTYYFWLTYDIASNATNGNFVDAVFNSTVISGSSFTPTNGNPTGNRVISNNVFYSIAPGNWSSTAIWSLTSGGPSCSCAPTLGSGAVFVNHPVTLDNNFTVNRVTVQTGGTLINAPTRALTVLGTLLTNGSGVFSASSSWNLNIVSTAGTGTSSLLSPLTLTGSLNVGAGSTLQVTGGAGMTVNGNITVDGTLDLGTSSLTNSNAAGTVVNGTGSITGSGTITFGVSKTIPDGSNLTIAPKIMISGSVTVTNNATVNMQNDIQGTGGSSIWTNAANSVLNMGGTSLMSPGTLNASAVSNTVNYNGSGAQNIKNADYYNLSVANSGTKSLNSNITVNNNILISSAAQLNSTGQTITLNKNWVNDGTSLTPFVGGTVSFNGDDTIYGSGITTFNAVNITSSGALASNSSTGKVIVTGDWTNDGDFDGNNSDVTFAGTTTISGSSAPAFNTIIVNPGATVNVTITNPPAEIDISGDLAVNGSFTTGSGRLVLFNGSGNTQNVNGSTTLLTLNDVEIDNTAGRVLLARPLAINGSLTLTNGNLNIAANNLTLSSSSGAVLGGPFSSSTMIVASGGGAVIKNGTSAASATFTFPVGDNIGTPEYSPITLNFSGTGYNGSASVKVTNAKHPNNVNTTNFLNRYWTVASTYASPTGTVTATYADADIVGTEASILMGRWGGAKPWTRFPASITTSTNALTSPGITSFGDFTGISSTSPTVSISFTQGAATACQGSTVTLQANATGDPTLTYLWSNAATTQTINPPTSTPGTINYTVTVTDGNGLTAQANQSVSVVASTTTAVAGTAVVTCSNSGAVSITAGASVTNAVSQVWTSSGTGTFTNQTSLTTATYTPSPADITAGSVILTLTATGSTCTAASTKALTITTAPTANAGGTQGTCSNSGAVSITGAVATNQTGVSWSTSGTGTFTNGNTLTPTYTPGAADITAGSVTLTLTVTGNSPCGNATSNKTLMIAAVPIANAGADQTGAATCGLTTITLAGNTPGAGQTGLWSVESGAGGSFGNASSATSTFTGTLGSTYTLRWTISSPPCIPSSDDMVVIFNTTPTTAAAGPGQRACGVTTTQLVANPPVFGTGAWSFAPGNTGTGGSFGDPSSPSSSFSGVEGQVYTLRWTITTPCGSSGNNVTIRFDPLISTPPVLLIGKKDVSSCGAGSDGIIKGFASQGVGTYTFTFTGGTQEIGPDSIIIRNLPPDHYVLRVRDNANNCTAVKDTNIIRLPDPSIEVSVLGNVSSCDPSELGFFTLRVFPRIGTIATGLKPFSFQLTPSVPGSFTPKISGPFTYSNLPQNTYQVTMTDSAGCVSNTLSGIVIGKDKQLTVELSGYHHPSCLGNDGDITVMAQGGSHSTYRYSISTDDVNFGPEQSGRRFVGLGPGTYTIMASDSRGCTGTRNVTLKTNIPTIAADTNNVRNCDGSDGQIIVRPSGGIRPISQYSLSTDNGATFTRNQTTQTFTGLPTGNMYAVRVTDARGCMSNTIKDITIVEPANCPPGIAGTASNPKFIAKNSLTVQALPNPTLTTFTLNLQSSSKERVQIIVTNMFGKKLYQATGSGNQQYVFGKQFVSGMYIVQVIQGKEIRTLKLVKGN